MLTARKGNADRAFSIFKYTSAENVRMKNDGIRKWKIAVSFAWAFIIQCDLLCYAVRMMNANTWLLGMGKFKMRSIYEWVQVEVHISESCPSESKKVFVCYNKKCTRAAFMKCE